MQSFVVWNDEIEGRLDCFFYQPIFVELEKKIRKLTSKTLGDYIINISGGATPEKDEPEQYYTESSENGVPFLRVQNVTEEGISLEDCKYINFDTHNGMLKRSQVKEGYLIIKITGVGRMAVSSVAPKGFEGNINQHLVAMKTDSYQTSEVLATFLNSDIVERLAFRRSTGGTRPALDYQALKTIPIVFRPEIVEIMQSAYNQKKQKETEAQRLLDSIDSYVLDELGIKLPEIKIKKCFLVWNNEVVQRLDPLYYSKEVFSFLRKFSYDVKPLEGITYYLKTGFAAGNSQQETVNEGIIQIRPTNIDDIGLLRFDKNIYLKKDYLDKKHDDLLQKGEVLFNNTNSQELVGKTSFFDLEGQYFCSNHITRIKVNEDFITPIYLWIILNIYQKAKIFFNLCTNWNNQSGVNIELLKTVKIPLPPLEIQNKIAEEVKRRISEAERLKAEASKIVEEAKKKVAEMILGTRS